MIVDGSASLELLLGQVGFYRRNFVQNGRIVLKDSLVAPGYDLHVGRRCLGVVFPKAIALSAVRLRGPHLGGHLGGVSQQTLGVLCRLELVSVQGLLALDAISRPGYRGQPFRVDILFAMQAGAIRSAG